jgi:hypothetical protein
MCSDQRHIEALTSCENAITEACISAAEATVHHTSSRQQGGRIPGWSDYRYVQPLLDKSLLWHRIWMDCDRPKFDAVADCVRHARSAYHWAIKHVRHKEDNIVRLRVADAFINNPTRNFWAEINKFEEMRLLRVK